jgi:hypothetical protein
MKIPPAPLFQRGAGGDFMLRCARKGMGVGKKVFQAGGIAVPATVREIAGSPTPGHNPGW